MVLFVIFLELLFKIFSRLNQILTVLLQRSRREYSRVKSDLKKFISMGGTVTDVQLITDDLKDNAGQASGHYFHQDLLVAQFINERNPRRHLDFGGRIDGFIAHVASYREIEVCDVRPLKSAIKNVLFLRQDLTEVNENYVTDSLSCLHSLEN